MAVDPSIFKEYDIRGLVPTQLNKETARKLGQFSVYQFKVKEIAVGRDMRISSPELFEAYITGITSMGASVVDIGLISTDMLWYASGKFNFPLSVMITASHNPKEWNGFKFALRGANALSGSTGIYALKDLLVKDFHLNKSQEAGKVTKRDVLDDWIKHCLSFVAKGDIKPLRVVVDAGNGMGGTATKLCLENLGVELVPLFFEQDGSFPNRNPDPTKDGNLIKLKDKIISEKAVFGAAFDPDADRIVFLDENGAKVSATFITIFLAKLLLEKYPGQTILYNAVIGRGAKEFIEKQGGKAVRVKVGHSLIKPKMRELEAIFAAENSYKFFYKDNYFSESGLITLLLFLKAVSKDGRRVSEIAKEYDKYPQSGEINFKVSDKQKILEGIKNEFQDAQNIDLLDGLSIWYSNWWFNLRLSNTENLVRLNIEANDIYSLKEKVSYLVNLIESLGGKKE